MVRITPDTPSGTWVRRVGLRLISVPSASHLGQPYSIQLSWAKIQSASRASIQSTRHRMAKYSSRMPAITGVKVR